MNTAARFHQGVLARGWVISLLLTQTQLLIGAWVFALLVSALSIVYVTYTTRSLHSAIEQTLIERDALHLQKNQLLLEKSTWIMQARVQQVAAQELEMVVPENKSIVIVNE